MMIQTRILKHGDKLFKAAVKCPECKGKSLRQTSKDVDSFLKYFHLVANQGTFVCNDCGCVFEAWNTDIEKLNSLTNEFAYPEKTGFPYLEKW